MLQASSPLSLWKTFGRGEGLLGNSEGMTRAGRDCCRFCRPWRCSSLSFRLLVARVLAGERRKDHMANAGQGNGRERQGSVRVPETHPFSCASIVLDMPFLSPPSSFPLTVSAHSTSSAERHCLSMWLQFYQL